MKRINLAPYLILAFFIALMFLWIYEGAAQENQKYMLIYQGSAGLNFFCLDELPYSIEREMIWDTEHGATELNERGDLFAQIVVVQDCYLDNLYETSEGQLYAWRFTSHDTDGHATHRHMTRGAFWVTWLRDMYR